MAHVPGAKSMYLWKTIVVCMYYKYRECSKAQVGGETDALSSPGAIHLWLFFCLRNKWKMVLLFGWIFSNNLNLRYQDEGGSSWSNLKSSVRKHKMVLMGRVHLWTYRLCEITSSLHNPKWDFNFFFVCFFLFFSWRVGDVELVLLHSRCSSRNLEHKPSIVETGLLFLFWGGAGASLHTH